MKPEYPEKTSRCRVKNQQTQPTYDAESGNRTRATLVGGECFRLLRHRCFPGMQEWRSDESTRLPLMWPGLSSGCSVVFSLLREIFLRVLRFSPLLSKTNSSKFQFDPECTVLSCCVGKQIQFPIPFPIFQCAFNSSLNA